MRWTCLNDIYKNLGVTSTRYVYSGDYCPKNAVLELCADPEDERANQIFLPDKIFANDTFFGEPTKVASFHYSIEIEDYGLCLQIITTQKMGIISFRSDSLKTIITRLHDEYNKFIAEIQGIEYKQTINDLHVVGPDLLATSYHEYNIWISLMMKISLSLALIGMIFSILVCASFKNEHPYRWHYLGALALDATLWTIILLIDRQKMLKISKLQRAESERLNAESNGASDNNRRAL